MYRALASGCPCKGLNTGTVAPTSDQILFHGESESGQCIHHSSKQSTRITTKLMGADNAKNKRMHGWSIHEAYVLSNAKLWSGTLGSIKAHVMPLGTQRRGARWDRTRYTKNVLLLVNVELFPLRGEQEIPNRELIELATGEGTVRRV
jgi:hypothetical protein